MLVTACEDTQKRGLRNCFREQHAQWGKSGQRPGQPFEGDSRSRSLTTVHCKASDTDCLFAPRSGVESVTGGPDVLWRRGLLETYRVYFTRSVFLRDALNVTVTVLVSLSSNISPGCPQRALLLTSVSAFLFGDRAMSD